MHGDSISQLARTQPFGRTFALACITLLAAVLSATEVRGQYCTPDQCDECNLCRCSQRCCHELPELWLINTRCAPRCKNLDCGFEKLIYKRYDRQCCRWVRESRESFLASESTMPTMFFAHGNSLNHENAMKQCWQVYCKMRCCPGTKRLVYWSWPAERVFKTERLRVREMIEKNLRIKYVYSEYQGYYMAKLVNQMSLSQRVMMAGHSYGGIITSAAAHFIGGGCLRGLTLAGGAAVARPNLRVGVVSGAFDHDMLIPGYRYGQTFVAAEKVYVTRNIKDKTLKNWPKTSWRCKKAIGVLGVNANRLGVHCSKLCQQTMTSDVGKSHYLKPHLKSTKFVAALCCLAFPQCSSCSPMATTAPANDSTLAAMQTTAGEQVLQPLEENFRVSDDQFAIESDEAFHFEQQASLSDGAVFSDAYPIEFTAANELDATVLKSGQLTLVTAAGLNLHDAQEVFADESVALAPSRSEALTTEAFLTEINLTAADAQQQAPTADAEMNSSGSATASEPTVATDAGPTSSRSSNRVWYRCGVFLAIVLSGQFYILFSKRVTPS